MQSFIEPLRLWPFALCVAFPRALGGRDATDYYGQSVPPGPAAAQASLLDEEGPVVPR
jgi:hypothetical protein